MAGLKKGSQMVSDRLARVVIDSASKAALIDLVADFLRRDAGDEKLDGRALADAFVEAMEPIARLRGDKPISVDKIAATLERHKAESAARQVTLRAFQETIDAFVREHDGRPFVGPATHGANNVTVTRNADGLYGVRTEHGPSGRRDGVVHLDKSSYAQAVNYAVSVLSVDLARAIFLK